MYAEKTNTSNPVLRDPSTGTYFSNPNYVSSPEARAINNSLRLGISFPSARYVDVKEIGDYFRAGIGSTGPMDDATDKLRKNLANHFKHENFREVILDIATGVAAETKNYEQLKGVLNRLYFMYSDAYHVDHDFGIAFTSPNSKYAPELNVLRKVVGKKVQEFKPEARWKGWKSDQNAYTVMRMFYDYIDTKTFSVMVRELQRTKVNVTAAPRTTDYYAEYLKVAQQAAPAASQATATAAAASVTLADVEAALKNSISRLGRAAGHDGVYATAGTLEGSLLATYGWAKSDATNMNIYNSALQRAGTEAQGMNLNIRDGMSAAEWNKINALIWEEFLKLNSPTSLDAFKSASDKNAFQLSFIRQMAMKDLVLFESWSQHTVVRPEYAEKMRKFAIENGPVAAADINTYFIIKFGLHSGGSMPWQEWTPTATAAPTQAPPVNTPMVA